MKVLESIAQRHSEDDFSSRLGILADSGAGVIHVRTSEVVRATMTTRKACLVDGNHYHEWDIANGFREFDISNMFKMNVTGDGNTDIHGCMAIPGQRISQAESEEVYTYFVYINPQYWLDENPILHHHLLHYSHILASTNIRVILITPDIPLPEILNDIVATVRFDPPSHAELLTYLDNVISGVDQDVINVDEEEKDRICYAGAGMSRVSFEMYSSLAIVQAAATEEEGEISIEAEDIVAGLSAGKTEVVNRNDLLELYPAESMEDVGGMENLKEWVAKRANCYSDEAKEFGIEAPKGMVFVGLPGTGKSLAAKAISTELGVPLVRLDFGRVFNSLVGKSEERMRTALRMVESMAPCVLFADEIDKGLGGIGGTGDSGTSSRVLGSFLTWLQENESPVFTMVTANNITGLPPELLRRGRFDAIFSTGFPTNEERREVLSIHLRKRGYDISKFNKAGVLGVINASRGYVPAEIESAIKDGLVDAFSADEEFTMAHVAAALGRMVPLSVTYSEQIQIMALWMANNATPASKKYEKSENVTEIGKGRRTRVRKIKEDDE